MKYLVFLPSDHNRMQPRIEILFPKKLIGKRLKMSLAGNRTAELWQSFRPRLTEIPNRTGTNLYSLQTYDPLYFSAFGPHREFEKWAAVEVAEIEKIPLELESFQLSGGKYAVFDYKGSSQDTRIFEYIFTEWLPASGYELDQRPHFEILGEKYKNNDPSSEEEIWIPIKPKA